MFVCLLSHCRFPSFRNGCYSCLEMTIDILSLSSKLIDICSFILHTSSSKSFSYSLLPNILTLEICPFLGNYSACKFISYDVPVQPVIPMFICLTQCSWPISKCPISMFIALWLWYQQVFAKRLYKFTFTLYVIT
jgi:hypothetical protein